MQKSYLILSIIMLLSFPMHAQSGFLDNDNLDKKMQVKLIEEFMVRFNRDVMPVVIDSFTENKEMKMLALLFDFNLMERRDKDVLEFVKTMLRDNVKLNFTDTNWSAEATCNVKYKKTEQKVTLVLRTEDIDRRMYKWVITQAVGDILALKPVRKSKSYKISPTDNELYFMQLADITKDESENILNYSQKAYHPDQTSVFFALVASGQLKIDYVEKIVYHFYTTHYNFDVSYFPREGTNSGWLISDFKKLDK